MAFFILGALAALVGAGFGLAACTVVGGGGVAVSLELTIVRIAAT
jgi:hypothetical protein